MMVLIGDGDSLLKYRYVGLWIILCYVFDTLRGRLIDFFVDLSIRNHFGFCGNSSVW